MPGTMISRGNILYSWMIAPTLTPVAVAANTTAEQAFTIAGVQTNDVLDVNVQAAQTAGVGVANIRVSAADTVQISFSNSTAGSLTPVSAKYAIVIRRPESVPLPTTAV